jgi:hypothetical protein
LALENPRHARSAARLGRLRHNPTLDFGNSPAQKQSQVTLGSTSFYAEWRSRHSAVAALGDAADVPPERLLQAIWQHQRLQRDQLRTLDGEPVRVLHPGFASVEGGPDFRGAVLQIGDGPPQSGDVEVDVRSSGWHAHGHDRNPAFQKVLLHVVWEAAGGQASARPRPAAPDKLKLELQPPPRAVEICDQLDAPLGELNWWLEREPVKPLPENLRGKCSAPLRELPGEQLTALLHQAARVRFEAKAAQLRARARHAGWEQALWEGLFRALGYKHNVWPMHCLAETRERWSTGSPSPLVLQARLLGMGSLLPTELPRTPSGTDDYLRRIWDGWWRERDEFQPCVLPPTVWRFHGLRPANHPQRRLALAAHWLARGDLLAKLERWCAATIADEALLASLVAILQQEQDEFWSWHWTFRSARLSKPQPLLGATRVTDLAINVILPWLWTRAAEGRSGKLGAEIERRYFSWPAAQDNSVLRLARQRLLGTSSQRMLRCAAHQQGLIQIVRDYCDHSNAVCDQCRFPELVQHWGAGESELQES